MTEWGRDGGALVNVDGRTGPATGAWVSPMDRGFLYGEAVYENLRTYGGEPFLLERHLIRLRQSAAFVGIEVPASDDVIGRRIRETQAAMEGDGEFSLRLTLTAGPAGGGPSLVVLVRRLAPLPAEVILRGVGVLLSDRVRAAPGGIPAHVKTTNLLGVRLAVREAEARGAHEAVLRDAGGALAEGATSNLFLVSGGTVRTPAAEGDLLPGITRQLTLKVLGEIGIPHEEARLPGDALRSADEAFLTSSSREVLPVTWWTAGNGVRVPVGSGRPGPRTRAALAAYRAARARIQTGSPAHPEPTGAGR